MDDNGYRDVLKDDESLAVFMKNMRKFDTLFCEFMGAKNEYTLRLESHGTAGRMVHCKVVSTSCERPRSTQRAIQGK